VNESNDYRSKPRTLSKALNRAPSLASSDRTVRSIVYSDLQLFPYKVQIIQKLLSNDLGTIIVFL